MNGLRVVRHSASRLRSDPRPDDVQSAGTAAGAVCFSRSGATVTETGRAPGASTAGSGWSQRVSEGTCLVSLAAPAPSQAATRRRATKQAKWCLDRAVERISFGVVVSHIGLSDLVACSWPLINSHERQISEPSGEFLPPDEVRHPRIAGNWASTNTTKN